MIIRFAISNQLGFLLSAIYASDVYIIQYFIIFVNSFLISKVFSLLLTVLFLFITLTYMTKTRLLFVFMAFILFFSACNDKTEPKFYYIENNSDEEVTVYNSSINITVGAKSNKKVDTVSELQYSLKRNKTIAEFTDSSKNINADIDYLSSTLEEGFVNGDYCCILKLKFFYA